MSETRFPVSGKLSRYLDTEGRLKSGPSRRSDQLEALRYLAARLPSDGEWSERELNELRQVEAVRCALLCGVWNLRTSVCWRPWMRSFRRAA